MEVVNENSSFPHLFSEDRSHSRKVNETSKLFSHPKFRVGFDRVFYVEN